MAQHFHCPRDCEHPQPFEWEEGRRFCGACFFDDGTWSEMLLCTPAICPDMPEET